MLALHCLKAGQGNGWEEHHQLFASPLFGSPGGGDPFDDGITAIYSSMHCMNRLSQCLLWR